MPGNGEIQPTPARQALPLAATVELDLQGHQALSAAGDLQCLCPRLPDLSLDFLGG
jgi:hypothetical protein